MFSTEMVPHSTNRILNDKPKSHQRRRTDPTTLSRPASPWLLNPISKQGEETLRNGRRSNCSSDRPLQHSFRTRHIYIRQQDIYTHPVYIYLS